MPYITPERRQALDEGEEIESIGEVNYGITRFILSALGPDPDYATYNTMIGVLESVKLELYRRMVAPYEDAKGEENGDVYPTTKASEVNSE